MKRRFHSGTVRDDGFALAETLAAGGLLLLVMTLMGRCVLVSGRMAALGTQLRRDAQQALDGRQMTDPESISVTVRIEEEEIEWELKAYQSSGGIYGIGGAGDGEIDGEVPDG